MRVILFVVAALLASGFAEAKDRCDEATDQASMNQCAAAAYAASDKRLNEVYRQVRDRLKDEPDTARALTAAQRAWIGYRDAECGFAASGVVGGSSYPMIHAMCLNGLTQARSKDLEGYLACEEGDLSCPVPSAN